MQHAAQHIIQPDQPHHIPNPPHHHDSGAGSGLSPNGQICLNALGFPQESIMAITTPIQVSQSAVSCVAPRVFRNHTNESKQNKTSTIQEHILVAGDQVLARSDYPRRLYEKYGVPLTGTLRGDLVDLLAGPLREAKALRLGQAVTNVAQLDDARCVMLCCVWGLLGRSNGCSDRSIIHPSMLIFSLAQRFFPPTPPPSIEWP